MHNETHREQMHLLNENCFISKHFRQFYDWYTLRVRAPEEIAKGEIKFSAKIFYGNSNYFLKLGECAVGWLFAAMH